MPVRDAPHDQHVDVEFTAIGQKLAEQGLQGLQLPGGRVVVDENQATTVAGVWAGGDCVVGGEDLTVSAVQHGKIAAIAIDRSLRHG
jgi:glutamate synthase (NADPH/NADH) small chain